VQLDDLAAQPVARGVHVRPCPLCHRVAEAGAEVAEDVVLADVEPAQRSRQTDPFGRNVVHASGRLHAEVLQIEMVSCRDAVTPLEQPLHQLAHRPGGREQHERDRPPDPFRQEASHGTAD
jgi:hypothetical protein